VFTETAQLYDALYAFQDLEQQARRLHSMIRTRNPTARSLLDVACGTGRHLARLTDYRREGVDLDRGMLAVARERCPDVPLHEGDMVTFDLGRRFDVVTCLFSSIAYVKTLDRMSRAIFNLARHVNPGGLVLVEPWFTPQTYLEGRLTANYLDEENLKIAWMYISEREDRLSVYDITYLVGKPGGVEVLHERHEFGLFTHEEYAAAFENASLTVTHDPEGLIGRGMYIGVAAP
jgi:SAM-dependent methyltransferase